MNTNNDNERNVKFHIPLENNDCNRTVIPQFVLLVLTFSSQKKFESSKVGIRFRNWWSPKTREIKREKQFRIVLLSRRTMAMYRTWTWTSPSCQKSLAGLQSRILSLVDQIFPSTTTTELSTFIWWQITNSTNKSRLSAMLSGNFLSSFQDVMHCIIGSRYPSRLVTRKYRWIAIVQWELGSYYTLRILQFVTRQYVWQITSTDN